MNIPKVLAMVLAGGEGSRLYPLTAERVKSAVPFGHRSGIPAIASRDWHTVDHVSFQEQGGPWPIHCVQDTAGAEFHPELALPPEVIRVGKGTRFDQDAYSAFDNTGLGEPGRAEAAETVPRSDTGYCRQRSKPGN